MEDMGWCPRCKEPTVLDLEKQRAECTNCCFIFCTQCQEKYHGQRRCEKLKVSLKTLKELGQSVDNQIKNISYKDKALFNKMSEAANLMYMVNCTKKCPNKTCKARI